jgi:hypothetical protein
MGGMRLFLEFFREPLVGTWSATQWQFLNFLQWGILLAMIISGIFLWWRERKPGSASAVQQPHEDQLQRIMGVALLLVFLIWQIREIFEKVEFLMIISVLAVSLAIALAVFVRTITTPQARLISISMLIAAFFTMGQSVEHIANDTIAQKYHGWFSIGPSGGLGAYDQITRDCSGNIVGQTQRNYSLWGATASYHYLLRPDRYFEASLRQYFISDKHPSDPLQDRQTFSISPFVSYDSRRFGIGLGSNFNRELLNEQQNNDPNYTEPPLRILPAIYLRYGNPEKIFFDMDFNNRIHYQGMNSLSQLGIGSGFGKMNYNYGRAGFTFDQEGRTGIYIGGDFLINNQVSLNTYFAYVSHPGFSLNLKWHLGKDRWKARSTVMPVTKLSK